MKKNIISFFAAVALHIFILIISSLIMGEKPNTFFEFHSTIPIQFSGESSQSKGHSTQNNGGKVESLNREKSEGQEADREVGGADNSATSTSSGRNNTFETSIVNYQAPIYPRIAQVRGLEGSVRIQITVSPEGLPVDKMIIQSSGHEVLDKAALEATTHWRFQKRDSAYSVEKNIVFKLKN